MNPDSRVVPIIAIRIGLKLRLQSYERAIWAFPFTVAFAGIGPNTFAVAGEIALQIVLL